MKVILLIILLLLPFRVNAHSALEGVGDVLQVAIPVTAMGLTALHRDWCGTKQGVFTLGLTQFTVFDLKMMINAKRPNGGGCSFPSGHTAISFASAGFIQRRYGWRYGAPFLGAATLVAISRLTCKAHWLDDVIVGAAIGWIYSRVFTRPFCPKLAIYPEISLRTAAISCHYCF